MWEKKTEAMTPAAGLSERQTSTKTTTQNDRLTSLPELCSSDTQLKSSSSESLSDKVSSELKKSFDAVVFDVLKVTPEEYAGQITLMDAPVFKAIQPEELSSCGWNKKEKHSSAPNVVAFTRRFNQKLFDINNFHAAMAVVSGLQSAPIFRLTKTWALLSRKDKATFDRLDFLMSKEDKYKRLRDYISSQSMVSCIPYLAQWIRQLSTDVRVSGSIASPGYMSKCPWADTEPPTADSHPQLCSAGPSTVEIGEGFVRKSIRRKKEKPCQNQHADNDPLWRP
ncbi:Ras-specific guanine nucleotide-releasing factor RalGPS1 [Channa argus]|uniref:Ras-specific guanine nucleotide-releasing factor RalGPS1 n=1 Tax=Channa argus TaxID=215402 RepID=A0A6G1PLS9_CHAAH|nr:Ras-specific guanine nucleotide-releasing factor RalGPS1 [Channa argus]